MSVQLRNDLQKMGIDISKFSKQTLNEIIRVADNIDNVDNISPDEIKKLTNIVANDKRYQKGKPNVKPRGYRVEVPKVSTKIGRNEKCPCGSGKKYKKCCLE